MRTQCNESAFEFQGLNRRRVTGLFDGGDITSDAGGVLLRETELRVGVIQQFSSCFTDHRHPDLIEHTVTELVSQRIIGLAMGYEDLNDHDQLRHDPLLALLVGKADPKGEDRKQEQDKGKALAGKSTLNRLELTPADADSRSRYKKIVACPKSLDRLFVDLFLQAHEESPQRIVLDFDATDDPIHGRQEGRFFHGYYRSYCYLPLYVFCGEHLLLARLRTSDRDGADGTVEELSRIVAHIRTQWPDVEILVRGDSGFCREAIMSWCEENRVDYVLGLAKNARLKKAIAEELEQARLIHERTGCSGRVFRDFTYQTRESWSRERRVVGKAEHMDGGANPRFVVSSLAMDEIGAKELYEELYAVRGDMENRIKEQQLHLFADRTSTAFMRANQLRLYFSSAAYTLMQALRRLGLPATEMAKAQCETIRLKLLKIGAQVRVTARRVWLSFSNAYPWEALFRAVWERLRSIPLLA